MDKKVFEEMSTASETASDPHEIQKKINKALEETGFHPAQPEMGSVVELKASPDSISVAETSAVPPVNEVSPAQEPRFKEGKSKALAKLKGTILGFNGIIARAKNAGWLGKDSYEQAGIDGAKLKKEGDDTDAIFKNLKELEKLAEVVLQRANEKIKKSGKKLRFGDALGESAREVLFEGRGELEKFLRYIEEKEKATQEHKEEMSSRLTPAEPVHDFDKDKFDEKYTIKDREFSEQAGVSIAAENEAEAGPTPDQERFIRDFLYNAFFHESNLKHIILELAEESGVQIPVTRIAELANTIRSPERNTAQLLLDSLTEEDIKRAVANPLKPDPNRLKELNDLLTQKFKKIIKKDFQDYFGKKEFVPTDEQREWLDLLADEAKEYQKEIMALQLSKEDIGEKTQEYAKELYQSYMVGQRGFTNELSEEVINFVINKV